MSRTSLQAELDALLSQDATSIVDRQRQRFECLIAPSGASFVLFGAGRLGRVALGGLRKAGVEPLAFADNNPHLWHTMVDGLEVLPPQEAADELRHRAVFIITVYTAEPVRRQLLNLDLRTASFASLAWAYPDTCAPHGAVEPPARIFKEADEVREAFSLWADDTSREEYLGQLRWRTSLDPTVLPAHLPPDEVYFPGDLLSPHADEVYVDCGAFDGDSVREFLRRRGSAFKQVIAIEPDPVNYERLKAYCTGFPDEIGSRVRALQVAAGPRVETVRFDATGTAASALGYGTYEVQAAPLDEILAEYAPTYIKVDIEGAELEALHGARRVIARDLPVLAICLYHRQQDLWQIPLFIRSLSSEYRLYLRRYSDDCWEQVCYAVPPGRVPAS